MLKSRLLLLVESKFNNECIFVQSSVWTIRHLIDACKSSVTRGHLVLFLCEEKLNIVFFQTPLNWKTLTWHGQRVGTQYDLLTLTISLDFVHIFSLLGVTKKSMSKGKPRSLPSFKFQLMICLTTALIQYIEPNISMLIPKGNRDNYKTLYSRTTFISSIRKTRPELWTLLNNVMI